jgi:hypothetical protein
MDAKTNAMKLAGRYIPLAMGLSIAVWMVTHTILVYRDGDTIGFDFLPLAVTIAVPVILGLIAWRWRLAAGIALVLLALVVLVYSFAQGDQWSWGWSSYLLMLTFSASLFAAGLFNFIVWQRESGTRVTIWEIGAEAVQEKADVMCWAARWVSLTVGAWLVVTGLAILVLWNSGVLEFEYGSRAVFLLLLVPLALAALAWRQHFVGGVLIALLSTGLLVYSIAKVDSWDSAAPFNVFTIIPSCVIFLVSGILHLFVWLRQMKAAR